MNEIAETKLSAIVFCGKLEEAQAKREERKLKQKKLKCTYENIDNGIRNDDHELITIYCHSQFL
jgi:hypothetical protein